MRLNKEQLEEICRKLGVSDLWSYSRYSSWNTSHYEWFLRYIKHENPANETSAYGPCGSLCHDIIEDYYENTDEPGMRKINDIARKYMTDRFEDEFTLNTDILGYKFDRTNEDKNKNIKHKYHDDIVHFFNHFKPRTNATSIEEFKTIKVADDIYFQGYLDCQEFKDNGFIKVVDFKTSSLFSQKSLVDHACQLVLYCEALHQQGVPVDKISCEFSMLKYAQIDYEVASGKTNSAIYERCQIGTKMANRVSMWLKKLGFDPEKYLDKLVETQDFSYLPDEVKDKFQMYDCFIEVPNWHDLWVDVYQPEIINTVRKINKLIDQYNTTHDETLFYDTKAQVKKESFYFANLSGYSVNQLPQYKEFLDNQNKVSNIIHNKEKQVDQVDDLSWLNSL